MTPQAQYVVTRAIHEVNQKTLNEAKQKVRAETMIEVARELKDDVDISKLAATTGLSIDEINRL